MGVGFCEQDGSGGKKDDGQWWEDKRKRCGNQNVWSAFGMSRVGGYIVCENCGANKAVVV